MVSKTKNKSSDNLNFQPILGINCTQCGENAVTKGISCNFISVFIHFTAISYITYHGIDDWAILVHESEHFTCISLISYGTVCLKLGIYQSPLFAETKTYIKDTVPSIMISIKNTHTQSEICIYAMVVEKI